MQHLQSRATRGALESAQLLKGLYVVKDPNIGDLCLYFDTNTGRQAPKRERLHLPVVLDSPFLRWLLHTCLIPTGTNVGTPSMTAHSDPL